MRIITGLVVSVGLAFSANVQAEKTVIKSEADLPRVTIQLQAKPSALVKDGGPAFDAMVEELKAYASDLSENYVIEDVTTKKGLLSLKRSLALHAGRWDEAVSYTPKIQQLEEKAAARETTGLTSDPFAIAMKKSASGSVSFADAFTKALTDRLAIVDVDVARNNLQQLQGSLKIISKDLLIGSFESQVDVVAENMGNNVPTSLAASILSSYRSLQTLDKVQAITLELVTATLEASPEEVSEDLWSERSTNIDSDNEVIIAIWDTGVDSALQGERMWRNPNAAKGDYPFGLAYGYDFELEPVSLLPKAEMYADDLDNMMSLLKGIQDLQSAINSKEAGEAQQIMTTLKRDEVLDFQTRLTVLGSYIHGQHVADIAAHNLSSAKLMNIRMSWPDDPIPTRAIDEAYVEKLIAAAKQSTALMQKEGVRVANMSWRLTRPMIEGLLVATGTEGSPEAAQKRAATIFEQLRVGLVEAFEAAPDVLFVAGAGNEDENVEFVQSVPAGINLPNLITIGAVDQGLVAAGFTSFGKSIDAYANGFEIEGRVPGGKVLKLSGTSMAAPQVANIAAKMFAVNPKLTVEQAITILLNTATVEGEQELRVVHDARAVAAAKAAK